MLQQLIEAEEKKKIADRKKLEELELEVARRKKEVEVHLRQKAYVKKLKDLLREASNVDLVFLLDVTGPTRLYSRLVLSNHISLFLSLDSMQPYIAGCKEAINDIVSQTRAEFPDMQLRTAFVGYRDFSEKEQHVVLDFVDDIRTFKQVLSSVQAFGGHDVCEDVFGGLNQVQSCCIFSYVLLLFVLMLVAVIIAFILSLKIPYLCFRWASLILQALSAFCFTSLTHLHMGCNITVTGINSKVPFLQRNMCISSLHLRELVYIFRA